jgi:hypothetical protein
LNVFKSWSPSGNTRPSTLPSDAVSTSHEASKCTAPETFIAEKPQWRRNDAKKPEPKKKAPAKKSQPELMFRHRPADQFLSKRFTCSYSPLRAPAARQPPALFFRPVPLQLLIVGRCNDPVERIRQIEAKALRQLRAPERARRLRALMAAR